MNHALVTIIASVKTADIPSLRVEIDKLGNPALPDVAAAIDSIGAVHFVSLNVIEAAADQGGHLVLEFSADDSQDGALLDAFADKLGPWLRPIFEKAESFPSGGSLASFLRRNSHALKQGYFSTLGLAFAGAPGMTVQRIRKESDLAQRVARILPRGDCALATLDHVRRELRADQTNDWNWAFKAEPAPLLGPDKPLLPALIGAALLGITTFLWPILLVMLAAWPLTYWWSGSGVWVIGVECILLMAALAASVIIVVRLRRMEDADQPDSGNPNPAHYTEITRRENCLTQNHLCVHSVLKPGFIRKFAIRLVFFVIGQLAARTYRPGFLGTLGTIHFARWVLVPGTRDLLFFSNYGGSWESYLEDFITKAHQGLTGVWSNTRGYPRTEWLINKGATDGERFKRWARSRQVASLFWYTAYGNLTTAVIRTNAAIRQGLAAAQTEDEARHWRSLFGSSFRPESALETLEIQSLVYGGFKRLPAAECLFFDWRDPAQASACLGVLNSFVAFGDLQPKRSAWILGLTSKALPKLGLPEDAVASFPNAFLQGMTEPFRSRILGDSGANDPQFWWWGKRDQPIDGAVLLYCKDADVLAAEIAHVERILHAHGGLVTSRVSLEGVSGTEPFGFADGISQPFIKGTFLAQRNPDPLNLVEPGEFILGYPDNRGYFPTTPAIDATYDPENLLPLVPGARDPHTAFARTVVNAPRDLGRNGTFLVLRQLEQDVDRFWGKMTEFGVEAGRSPVWVAAKMIGRWPDGSSLVRNPTFSATWKPGTPPTFRPPLDSGESTGPSGQSIPPDAGAAPEPPTPLPGMCPMGPPPQKTESKSSAPVADNDFLFGAEDEQGLRCPFGAHIRRANPRDSFTPGSQEQVAITNRHRLLRRGRAYRPAANQKPGLMFACLNADLERQFEFVQQTWVNNKTFHGLHDEPDPLLNDGDKASFTIPSPHGPVKLTGLSQFVTVRGGSYLFLPGKRTLEFLSRKPASPAP